MVYGIINRDLARLEESGNRIGVGLVGAGNMGTDIISQISRMKGLRTVAVADIRLDYAYRGYELAGYARADIIEAKTPREADEAARRGRPVVTEDGFLLTKMDEVDVLIEATGNPGVGARLAWEAITNGKHIVMMNVETDVTVGPILNRLARQVGVVYTLSAGDEPGAIMELYDFCDALGLRVVCAGKGKNNPVNFDATPDMYAEEAARRDLTPEMLVEFIDGSKTMIEMAAVANATGLVPDVPGMHGPTTTLAKLKEVFALKTQGGILNKEGVVDWAIGDIAPGVFVIATTDQERLIQCLRLRDMGCGPNYLFYRPYHLCSMETPLSAAAAVLYKQATMFPKERLVAEVTAIAKRDLRPGEVLDRIGGYTYRCSIETREDAKAKNALPAGLAKGAKVLAPIKKGETIRYDQVELPESFLLQLRKIQDMLTEG
ncbi:MAG: NAD(P)H-dependent oxidoreductase [Bacillota bacterium]